MNSILPDSSWLALTIGNSRLHWAWFVGENLCRTWDTQYLPASVVPQLANCRTIDDLPAEILPTNSCTGGFIRNACEQTDNFVKPAPTTSARSPLLDRPLPLYLASVVPSQTELWQAYPNIHIITLDRIPLQGVYSTLGIDRALALCGAGETWDYPILVIDAGTALTFTGADANHRLIGGAILPGVSLQLQSLAQRTSALPLVETQNALSLPQRWALNTPDSIQSGVIYTIIAGIRDFIQSWWQEFPESNVVLTGGDGNLLLNYLRSHPDIASKVIADPHLIFWGMRSCRKNQEL